MRIVHRNPTSDEYNELRELAGWPIMDKELVSVGIANSIFAVVALDNDGLVTGMGRIVGDNAIYFHIQDVIVRPGLQRTGIGKLIMNDLLRYIEKAGGKNTNIGLMCSKGREAFYRQFGFIERPNERFGAGMIMIRE